MSNNKCGEGSISQRKDGTWTGRIFLGRDSNGKQKIKAFYGKTKSDVKQQLKVFKEASTKYKCNVAYKLTFAELLTYWLENVKRNELKASSFDRLEITINKHIIPLLGYYRIDKLASADIQSFINNRVDNGFSYSTIKKDYNAINAALRLAVERDYLYKNPCTSVSLPKQIKREKYDIEHFSDLEIDLIVKSAIYKYSTGRYKYKHGYAIILLLNTGMRVGELLALKWHNVDFENKQIYIEETRGQIKDRASEEHKYISVDRSTKTQSSCRYILINEKAEEALIYLKSLGYSNSYVMANSDNNVITYRNLFRVLSNILKDNNINHGSLHTLRHTFATNLFKNGVDIKVISELLGHSDISITYNIYTHVIKEQKKKAVEVLNCL